MHVDTRKKSGWFFSFPSPDLSGSQAQLGNAVRQALLARDWESNGKQSLGARATLKYIKRRKAGYGALNLGETSNLAETRLTRPAALFVATSQVLGVPIPLQVPQLPT